MPLFLLALVALPISASNEVVSSSVTIDGRLRVQALSPTLFRFEPRGASGGFEDRTTFLVARRDEFDGTPLRVLNQTQEEAWLATRNLLIHVAAVGHPIAGWSASIFDSVGGEALWSSPDLARVNNTLWWPLPLLRDARRARVDLVGDAFDVHLIAAVRHLHRDVPSPLERAPLAFRRRPAAGAGRRSL